MTEKDFQQNIEIKKEMELLYRGTRFTVNYGIDNNGKEYIAFGEENLPLKRFTTYGQLVNEAMLGFSPLRYSIESLELLNP